MTAVPTLIRPMPVRALIHTLLPYSWRFRLLLESRIPKQLSQDASSGGYDLIIVNDIDLLPWAVRSGPSLLSKNPGARIHLDVHEFHLWAADENLPRLQERSLRGYHGWLRGHIASPVFATRSTVADGIADLYAAEFQIERPLIVRNSPAYVELSPTPVDPDRIRLIYHGNAEMTRGLGLLVEAFRMVDERFTLTFMLTGHDEGKRTLRELTHGLADRIEFRDAVPMREVATALNAFDLEVIFYPPTSPNFLYSFPNKFFESVQGRIGVVVGESPSMTAVVNEFGNGAIVPGWTAADLAAGLNALTAEQIDGFKRGSDRCAHVLNSGTEKAHFLESIAGVNA
ncbi:glycosyltransferase [Leifsonia poae]|uniref:glycosyltransferase n=1 Tax=Leifsonia poae TaxID=110933 RepID=UPI003D66D07C